MPKIILGLAGEIASGKDTVAAYLKKKYGSETVSFSQPLRDIADRLYLPQSRENLVWLGNDLRARFGQDILAKAVGEEVKQSQKKIIVLPNVRLPQDIKFLKKLPGFYLVAINTDAKIRYARLTKRRQNTDDQTKTWAQFLKDSKLPTEIKIRGLAKKAKYKIDNNGTFIELNKQIDEIIRDIKK